MKQNSLVILLLFVAASLAAGGQQKIAFEREDNSIWVANLDGTGAKKIASGDDPDISPDGTKLAYNTLSATGPQRSIAVVDLATGVSTVFKDVPSDNAYGPLWSPNGTKVLFYILINNNWEIGVANADGSGFRVLKGAGPNNQYFFSACWMPDGKSLFCQDLTNLYQITTEGEVMKQWPLQQLFPKGDLDSNVRIDASADGTALLMDVNSDTDSGRGGWDGPPPQIWEMNLSTEKAAPITPIFWWEPCWVSADEYLCITQGAKEKEPSIYLRSLDGKTKKVVVKGAMNPSVSK